jgi:signal transduction histidine kinase/DNA-binding response OmpR family regulator
VAISIPMQSTGSDFSVEEDSSYRVVREARLRWLLGVVPGVVLVACLYFAVLTGMHGLRLVTHILVVGAFLYPIPLWLTRRRRFDAARHTFGVITLALVFGVMMAVGNRAGHVDFLHLLFLCIAINSYALFFENPLKPTRTTRMRWLSAHAYALVSLVGFFVVEFDWIIFDPIGDVGEQFITKAWSSGFEKNALDFFGEVHRSIFTALIAFMVVPVAVLTRSIARAEEHLVEVNRRNRELSEALTEQRVRERTRILEESNRHKSEFLASMSHELRTPLNAIIGYSEMLQEEAQEQGAGGMVPDLRRIQGAGRHLLELINAVLDLSKIEAGRLEVHREEVALGEALEQVVAVAQPLSKARSNRFHVVVAEPARRVRVDLTKLKQVLLNLLGNAFKFTSEGTVRLEVQAEAESGADWLVVTVSDTGIGMTAEQLSRLFEEYWQAAPAEGGAPVGTGLGLSLSRRLCRLMGGDIEVHSRAGEGSRFTVRLPVGQPVALERATVGGGKAGKVLVVDDDEVIRDQLRRYLEKDGFQVVTAASAEQGLELARAQSPDVITLDVLMPGVDGWRLLTQLKAVPALSGTPVIMLSVLDEHRTGYALGAADYLSKPVDRERLLKVLEPYRRGRHVLVVDDDEDVRAVLRRTLRAEGYSVVEAANGREALEAIADAKPDAIVLDLMMPEVDGFEVVEALAGRQDWREIPVIVLTGLTVNERERQRLTGAVMTVLRKDSGSGEGWLAEVRAQVRACLANEGER